MDWALVRKSMVLLLLPIAGCGEGAETTATVREVQDPAAVLLIQEDDLPPGNVEAEAIPEPCSPIPVLEQQGAEVLATPLFRIGNSSAAEVVGVMPSEGRARQALTALKGRERMLCIRSTIENFGPREGDSVSIGAFKPVSAGDEGSMVHLLEVDSASQPVNSTTIVSLRSNRCVATMLFLREGGSPKAALTDRLSGRAYERLEDAHSFCR
jgi:hypothetical protein